MPTAAPAAPPTPRHQLLVLSVLALTAGLLAAPPAQAQRQPPAPGVDGLLTDRPAPRPLTLPEEEQTFVFALFGDRTGGPAEGVQVLAEAVDEVNLIEPDLVLTVGDLIQGYTDDEQVWLEQMREYTGIMDRLKAPWFPVAGNHDVYWRGQGSPPPGEHEGLYEQHFGPLWYAFEHKQAWFLVLYTDEGDPATGEKAFRKPAAQRMSPEQFAWLDRTLTRAADARHVFVFVHHPRWIGGGYGDDWDRVHERLVRAGNVTAVFGGHIHRMRYDPRDGIEYFALATTGGGQGALVPEAGWLHHYELVMVREDHIAVASYPVGSADDPRALTGELVLEAERLARDFGLDLGDGLALDGDLAVQAELPLRLHNPVEHPVAVTLVWQSDDEGWLARPDHLHVTLQPGERLTVPARLARFGGGTLAGLSLDVGLELLHDRLAVPLPVRRVPVPLTAELTAPPVPRRNHALHCDGEDDALSRPGPALPEGPVTLELRLAPERLAGRQGLVTTRAGGDLGLFLEDGEPSLRLHLDGVDRVARAAGRPLAEGAWYDLAGVFDGQELRLYLDGELLASAPARGTRPASDLPLLIGAGVDARGQATAPFAGWIDEVRISAGARYAGPRYQPGRRRPADADTQLLLHADGAAGPWLFDASPRRAHPRRLGGLRVDPVP